MSIRNFMFFTWVIALKEANTSNTNGRNGKRISDHILLKMMRLQSNKGTNPRKKT